MQTPASGTPPPPPPIAAPGGAVGGDRSTLVDDPFKTAVRNLTVLIALVAYVGLALYIVVQTWDARGGTAPTVPNVQAAALGALAVALGAGYAVILGVAPKTRQELGIAEDDSAFRAFWKWLTAASAGTWLLGLGALAYLFVGVVISATYAFNEQETPTVLSTIAVGFGGYVIAYLGAAYQKMAD
jgi:hypothetical protein